MKKLTLEEELSLLNQEMIGIRSKMREVVSLIDKETEVDPNLLYEYRELYLEKETDRVRESVMEFEYVDEEMEVTSIHDLLMYGNDLYPEDEELQEVISKIRLEIGVTKLARG